MTWCSEPQRWQALQENIQFASLVFIYNIHAHIRTQCHFIMPIFKIEDYVIVAGFMLVYFRMFIRQ